MGRLLTLVGVTTRLGLAGGALYTSNQLGVWGNCKQGEQVRLRTRLEAKCISIPPPQVYNKLKTAQWKDVLPAEALEYAQYAPELPDLGVAEQLSSVAAAVAETRANFWPLYNSAVTAGLNTATDLPNLATGLVTQAADWVQEQSRLDEVRRDEQTKSKAEE